MTQRRLAGGHEKKDDVRRVLILVCVASGITGCARRDRLGPEDNPTTVRDATGVEFGWDCDPSGCEVVEAATTPPPNSCPAPGAPTYAFAWGRFVEICSVCLSDDPPGWSTTAERCRILACDRDENCPALYQATPSINYVCENGLCQNPADVGESLTQFEVEQLCFAVVPRSTRAELDVREKIETSCPGAGPADACALPEGCRAP